MCFVCNDLQFLIFTACLSVHSWMNLNILAPVSHTICVYRALQTNLVLFAVLLVHMLMTHKHLS